MAKRKVPASPPATDSVPPAQMTLNRDEMSLITNSLLSRSSFLKKFMDPRRDLDAECGYLTTITPQHYQLMYDREPYAARVVEVFPNESWDDSPEIYEDEDPDKVTAFEEDWDAIGKSIQVEESYHKEEEGSPVWEVLERADIQSRIGRYGVILIGLNDGRELNLPATRRARQRLTFLRVFPESMASVSQLDNDKASPRNGMPVMYSLTFNDPNSLTGVTASGVSTRTQDVHWTRIVHIADGRTSSEWAGTPAMQQVFNPLQDIQKIRASGAEGYWRAVVSILSLETHPQLGGDVVVNMEKMRRMLEDMYGGTSRDIILQGMTAKTLAPQVVDPNPHIQANVEAICVKLGIPIPIFKGFEIGEQASTENTQQWGKRKNHRRQKYLTPRVIVPFVDRLINLGCLRPPKDGYFVAWPDATRRNETEEATVLGARTTAMVAYVSGGGNQLMTEMDYLTREMGFEEEEAQAILDNVAEAQEEMDAENELLAGENGLVPAPPEGFVDPAQADQEHEKQLELIDAKGKAGAKGKKPPVGNAFCPTGEGGGIDNSCSSKESMSSLSEREIARASSSKSYAQSLRGLINDEDLSTFDKKFGTSEPSKTSGSSPTSTHLPEELQHHAGVIAAKSLGGPVTSKQYKEAERSMEKAGYSVRHYRETSQWVKYDEKGGK